jgi:hypothetical protein
LNKYALFKGGKEVILGQHLGAGKYFLIETQETVQYDDRQIISQEGVSKRRARVWQGPWPKGATSAQDAIRRIEESSRDSDGTDGQQSGVPSDDFAFTGRRGGIGQGKRRTA